MVLSASSTPRFALIVNSTPSPTKKNIQKIIFVWGTHPPTFCTQFQVTSEAASALFLICFGSILLTILRRLKPSGRQSRKIDTTQNLHLLVHYHLEGCRLSNEEGKCGIPAWNRPFIRLFLCLSKPYASKPGNILSWRNLLKLISCLSCFSFPTDHLVQPTHRPLETGDRQRVQRKTMYLRVSWGILH